MTANLQDLWEREHSSQTGFTTMHTTKPSQVVPAFADFLVQSGYTPAETRIIDIGCGKGRNSIYLAERGFRVTGTDFSERALADARVRGAAVSQLLEFEFVDLTKEWPYPNNHFDALIDSNVSIFIPDIQRQFTIAEAFRVLKQGGCYLFYGIAASQTVTPGVTSAASTREPVISSVTVPADMVPEKHYTEDELKSAYDMFQIASMGTIRASDRMNGKDVENTMWVAVFRKPL
ncbi:MAG: class I SAM-dependent methyltransferase [Patescibacteria group bacterium]|nr:class I SAM-dependent methyltransferase [Patescibacteria group bacterium]